MKIIYIYISLLTLVALKVEAQGLNVPIVSDCSMSDGDIVLTTDKIYIENNIYYNGKLIDSINICDFPEITTSNNDFVNFNAAENSGLQIIFDSTQLVSMGVIGKNGFIKVYSYPIFIINMDTTDIQIGNYGLCFINLEFEIRKDIWKDLKLTTPLDYLIECATEPIEKVFIAPKHIAVVLLPKLIEMEQHNFRFGINEYKSIPYKLRK